MSSTRRAYGFLLAFLVVGGLFVVGPVESSAPEPAPAPEPADRHFILDGSIVTVMFLAILTLVVAGYEARVQTRRELTKLRQKLLAGRGAADGALDEDEEEPTLVVSEKIAVFIVVQATVGLLVLYFLLNKVFFKIILGFYALISTQAVGLQLCTVFEVLGERRGEDERELRPLWYERTFVLPVFGPCRLYQLANFVVALTLSVTWFAIRLHSKWAWILQDISGCCIILTILTFLKIPNLRIASILLPLIMCYDIFFVYIQPMLFHNESVMKKVATGGSAHEIMPMALIVPNFRNPDAMAMLGYGDVALPGLLLVYAASFDEYKRNRGWSGYFVLEILGYVLGLVATVGALALDVGGQQGQPALLYLVPFTLGPILLAAYWRKDFREMFKSDLVFLDQSALSGAAVHGGRGEDQELLLDLSPN